MQTCKPSEADLQDLKEAALLLKTANSQSSKANKEVEAAKERLSKWLKEKRDIDITTLQVGDMVLIDGVCLIEIGKQNKFDGNALMLEDPKLYEAYKREVAVKKFKPLV